MSPHRLVAPDWNSANPFFILIRFLAALFIAALLAAFLLTSRSAYGYRDDRQRCLEDDHAANCSPVIVAEEAHPLINRSPDRRVFHLLVENRHQIRRSIKLIDGGIQSVTESDNPLVRTLILRHLVAMKRRLESGEPIHVRDPLFREIFAYADEIQMDIEPTLKGAIVTETSDNPKVVFLIRERARVISEFLEKGMNAVDQDHPVTYPEP